MYKEYSNVMLSLNKPNYQSVVMFPKMGEVGLVGWRVCGFVGWWAGGGWIDANCNYIAQLGPNNFMLENFVSKKQQFKKCW